MVSNLSGTTLEAGKQWSNTSESRRKNNFGNYYNYKLIIINYNIYHCMHVAKLYIQ